MTTCLEKRYDVDSSHTKCGDSGHIGMGNFSSVVLCRPQAAAFTGRTGIPQYVVAKRVSKANATHVAVLMREWKAFTTINRAYGVESGTFASPHPAIIGAFELLDSEFDMALILEYAPFGDLMSYLQSRRRRGLGGLDEAQIRTVSSQVLTALVLLHDAGYAHRDVKPHNLLVASECPLAVKVADLGLVKQLGSGMLWARQNSAGDYALLPPDLQDRTKDGMAIRRHDYVKADVYAFGLTLYYLLAGSLPTASDLALLRFPTERSARWPFVTAECLAALAALLDDSTDARPSAAEALSMPWFSISLPEERVSVTEIHGTSCAVATDVDDVATAPIGDDRRQSSDQSGAGVEHRMVLEREFTDFVKASSGLEADDSEDGINSAGADCVA